MLLALALGLCGLLFATTAWAGVEDYSLWLEAGPVVDSNSLRGDDCQSSACGAAAGDSVAPVTSALMQMTADGNLRLKVGGVRFGLGYGGGAKIFFAEAARQADELVHHLRGSVALPSRKVGIGLSANYYEAFQRVSTRDFRTAAFFSTFTVAHASATTATLRLGYFGLHYKPSVDFGFQSLVAGLALSRRLSSGPADERVNWRLRLSYNATLRGYEGKATTAPEACSTDPSGWCTQLDQDRRDLNQLINVSIQYLGAANARFFYSAEINSSNSFGEAFVRHAVGMKFTAPLYWKFYLTAKGVLQFAKFDEPYNREVTSSSFTSIDDENRSTLVLHLARDISKRWSFGLRYAIYLNETQNEAAGKPAETPSFLRHLLFLGLRYRLEPEE